MNFTFVWIMDKLGFSPKEKDPVKKPRKAAKKVANTTTKPRKRRLG
jgi:hypothetical protein